LLAVWGRASQTCAKIAALRAGQAVEERALAGVGVAHQGHRGHRHRLAPLPLLLAHPAHRLQIELQLVDAPLNLPPVGFQLGFAGSAGADAAAQLRHGFALAGQPRQHVLKLRQLHLQLALAGPCVAGKNIQDQLRAVQHAAGQRRLKIAQLRGRKVVVEEHQIGFGGSGYAGNLLHLAGADQRSRIGPGAPLHAHSAATTPPALDAPARETRPATPQRPGPVRALFARLRLA
jgi:hypothetical protein